MVQIIRKTNKALWDRIGKAAKDLDGTALRVGWFETQKYEDGTPVAYAAVINEFGYPKGNIPARPFMRPTVAREEENWRKLIEQEALKIYAGTTTPEELFEKLGLSVSGGIGKSISAVFAPPLKPATIAARKRRRADKKTLGNLDKPLVDTGIMITTVTHIVSKS